MLRFNRASLVAALSLALVLYSCDTPDDIAKFCSSANTSLKSGDAIFDDIQASCLRARAAYAPFTSFEPNPLKKSAEGESCDPYKDEVEGLKAANKILANYFVTLNSLASFGAVKASDDSSDSKKKATDDSSDSKHKTTDDTGDLKKTAAKADKSHPDVSSAAQGLASLLERLVMAGYQRKHLDQDIQQANGSVLMVTDALKSVVENEYRILLDKEQSDLAARYKRLLEDNPCSSSNGSVAGHNCHLDALIMLQNNWQQDVATLETKRKAAKEFASALDAIAKGHAALAANVSRLKAKDLPGLLSPFADELEKSTAALSKL